MTRILGGLSGIGDTSTRARYHGRYKAKVLSLNRQLPATTEKDCTEAKKSRRVSMDIQLPRLGDRGRYPMETHTQAC